MKSIFDLPLRLEDLQWPYAGMVRDLQVAINGRANILAGLALLVFTEVMGRLIFMARLPTGQRSKIGHAQAFQIFYEKYMGQPKGSGPRVFGIFRSGLVHTLEFGKAKDSYVLMRPDAQWIAPEKHSPLIEDDNRSVKGLNVSAYWREWQRGLGKWAAERPELVVRPSATPNT